MKFSAMRQHKKINANCEQMMQEYLEMIRIGHEARAATIRKRIVTRYGKEVFEILSTVNDETED
ncbi:hypothetical protein COW36_23305 [bacterium (Candidatus Blackallbacteria) CG17_big_fil_post_rev_8_21_14_2_50_48_46]|uniref:Uncharacterized protein n=1 Tax=bacterium (Candidatus Blackallbacteria) CG17_big_fil_post_rev_8_21_14_2_50_48_46 TaxID=2014261 RepID=A0A2M7FXJ7_9BACT|nr:MAG: hypothetical protein COW64_17520 [bacterium (Candidatus Blackallbacteria) CG18_big_fil_WC_8_21_14_2_50_49_26]PIW13971.1 MAG: hypothetical protein COW36_23305 [bacterium (Candidatus Blackallbacteria) CG17_big_fil_post_rev_8_21_14_2_50_48_46]PIW46822.1 MAG: hypothetical protein COW20_14485 [bacterium (Candidatus Blackallbacteria) CG13_big_fil_rev_8_21_14_2_50_49_14]